MKDGEKDGKMVVLKVGKRGRMRKSKKKQDRQEIEGGNGQNGKSPALDASRRDNQSLFELDDCDRKR